ncbi:MAG: 4-hydroxythreonine-4-phosphate dehydrogenase PdxA [Thermoflavifilum sp.]|nr:4-hydroxythreonine-4-phosphate dehydrogenase PdxA [Thermoflavifilum sp.]MCL6513779.1 4-hydroxythreonine-4-phosphate dehydrogenase PdxA [Alicyclobacillus sp.]
MSGQTGKVTLAITIGDPAGIGPEITLKALTHAAVYEMARPLVIGSLQVLEDIRARLGIPVLLHAVASPGEAQGTPGHVDVLDVDNIDVTQLRLGEVQAICGKAAFEYIQTATRLGLDGHVNAIVTAPIHKEALRAADVPYIGHTEMLAGLMGLENEADALTMFEVQSLRIFFLTRHLSLVEACRRIANPDFVLAGIRRTYRALTSLVGQEAVLAVAALNPHAGEGGLLGSEEQSSLRPAIEKAQEEGLRVEGPIPADSVFHLAREGRYDAVLSLYHDQGHIAAKVLDFERTVSVTLGLPVLRTSVDHGTAFDIAGRGLASEVSMVEAILTATRYAHRYAAPARK